MNWSKWLSVPYRKGGRTMEGCDCWGFTRLVVGEEQGVDLPAWQDSRTLTEIERARFREIPRPEEGCIVLMRHMGGDIHTGVWTCGMILHMTDRGPACQPEGRLKPFVEGYYVPL
ncbi:MAG: NlpC/P60 family protein [Sphaerochaetaceae bacterium]|nr:NlpC/P60 family protein [Spirochaetales bacterium]MDY5500675.1 NlpC/P60 family protein [Sphaerochaetaceae bacterium]